MNSQNFDKRKLQLEKLLVSALQGPHRSFSEKGTLNVQGIYFIFHGEEIIYIGKTKRQGKKRLSEMIADFRSHTINRKLFKEYLEPKLGYELKFNNSIKKTLVENGAISLEEFKLGQLHINNFIKQELTFKFHEIDLEFLTSLEHFAIAIINPKYND